MATTRHTFRHYDVRDFGAVGDGASHPLSEFFPTLAAAQATYRQATALANEIDWCATVAAMTEASTHAGGVVRVPAGRYRLHASLIVPAGVILEGDGGAYATSGGTPWSGGVSELIFNAGVTGVVFTAGTVKTGARDLYLRAYTTGSGARADGVRIQAKVILDNVTVWAFTRDGVHVDTSAGGNANNCEFRSVWAAQCGRDGFHVEGADSNAMTFLKCDATANARYGFYDGSLNNVYIAPHMDSNAGGAFRIAAGSAAGSVYGPYVEGAPSPAVVFEAGSLGWLWNGNLSDRNGAISVLGGGPHDVRFARKRAVLTEAPAVVVDAVLGSYFTLQLGASRVIAAPSNPTDGKIVTFRLTNLSAGTIRTTWAGGPGGYLLNAPWVDAGSNRSRLVTFIYDGSLNVWVEMFRSVHEL